MTHTDPNEVGVALLVFSLLAVIVALLWGRGCVPEPEEAPVTVKSEELVVVVSLNAPLRFSPFATPSTSSL